MPLLLVILSTLISTTHARTAVVDSLPTGEGRGGASTTVSYQIGFDKTKLLDTYLSQERFSGPGFTFLTTWERNKASKRWSTLMENQVNFSSTNDGSGDRSELEGSYNIFIGRLRSWHLSDSRWTLQAGGMVNVGIGFIYNTSNSNNPAQARLSAMLMPVGIATYRFNRATFRYELELPLVGLMFSPNYGQSYYEIFSRGNYDHNVVPTTWDSAPYLRQQLSFDLTFWRTTALRVGFICDYQQSEVNKIKTHVNSFRIMVGIVKRFKIINLQP